MHNGLQNVLFGYNALRVFDEVVSLFGLIILQIEDHKVESSFRNNVNKWRQNLKGIFSPSEYDEIVPKNIIFLYGVT